MAHPLEKLRATLDELDRELAAVDTVDPHTRSLLEEARAEIQTAIDQQDAAQLQSQSLVDRLKDAEQEFEASHPNLAGIVMRMINTLAQLGI